MDPPSSATPTPYAGAETASKPWETLTDLASVDGNHLSRLPETEVRAKELSGQLYSDIFRRLQIRPGKYEDFYNGVVRFIRNKHVAEIKRGTNASFTYTSRLLLRAFGYIVWPPGSEWLIDDADLSAGEVRLTYSRKKETAHQDDTGYV